MPETLSRSSYQRLVTEALAEDLGPGDITSAAIFSASDTANAAFIAKTACVLAGLDVAAEVFGQIDTRVVWQSSLRDGDRCDAGTTIARLAGPARAILAGERTALNFLQHLSGIATAAREFVDAADGKLVILDTRKTVPGLRMLAKYAARCGGATNHRVGLYDGILIKDNHIRAAGSIAEAMRRVRATGTGLPIEVEVEDHSQLDEAMAAGADIVMLDNFADAEVRAAVAHVGGRARVEVSGQMTVPRVAALADSGADCISVGAITHSARAADISLEIDLDVRSVAP